jgi:hypothetical protein
MLKAGDAYSNHWELRANRSTACTEDVSPCLSLNTRNGQLTGGNSSHGRVKNFLRSVQTDPGAHPGSYSICSGGHFPGDKAAGELSRPLASN